jgi:hypothetical protein
MSAAPSRARLRVNLRILFFIIITVEPVNVLAKSSKTDTIGEQFKAGQLLMFTG